MEGKDEREEWIQELQRVNNTKIAISVLKIQTFYHRMEFLRKKAAIRYIWSAYRRLCFKTLMDIKVQERHNKTTVFDADIIYILDIKVIRGHDLVSGINTFVDIKCVDKSYRTRSIQNTSNPEWNESVQFHFYQQPEEIIFNVMNKTEQGDMKIGECTYKLTSDIFLTDILGTFAPFSCGLPVKYLYK